MNRIHTISLLGLAICATQGIAAKPSFTGFTVGATAGLAHCSVGCSGYIGVGYRFQAQ